MITTVKQLIDEQSFQHLAALRGHKWRCFGGPDVSDWLTDVTVFFCTDGPSVTVAGVTDYLDFESEEDTYSLFGIDVGAADFEAAKKMGGLYFFYAGQQVTDVFIVRETIVETRDGQQTWRYITDIGIIFTLANGVVAVAKVSQHTELLCIVKADTLDELHIDEPSSGWEDRLGIEYTTDRQFIPIDNLLRDAENCRAEEAQASDETAR